MIARSGRGPKTCVSGQCCGSGMFIPDPKTAIKERGENVVIPFYVATNFTKLKTILVLKC
jgi:hypothetical protein